ncbi:DUF1080 domain-containing protein [Flavihumibacter sp. CACIAM 22H1]|uniref:3-keto-disaccharide hydrolase n=1 Tax=Flavihumibacter sp. CACIAM 22H1 TaxID=1812911 RepID=UPI0007A837A8|nr:DUF1080 domain-containing protein [Flavihumibacter sp. CACIAM 22H1]KYP14401.1 MAG: hypothetical protein A1D16_17860 [Flavihumibacter sp. CACIAM 22H1]
MKRVVLALALTGCCWGACRPGKPPSAAQNALFQDTAAFGNWTAINVPKQEWSWLNDTLQTQAGGSGYLRSPYLAGDFILSFDAFAEAGETPDLVVFADALPAKGSPYPDGSPIFLEKKKWNRYIVESTNGQIRVFAGNKLVRTMSTAGRTAGYICFLKDASVRKITRIRFTATSPAPAATDGSAEMDPRFQPLYNGTELSEFQLKPGHIGHWTAAGWLINYDGLSTEQDKCLWTKKSYRDFELIADLRLTRQPTAEWSPVVLPSGEEARNPDGSIKQVLELYAGDTGIYLRGNSKNQVNIGYRYLGSGEIYGYRVDKKMPAELRQAVTPLVKADNFPGQWNRFYLRLVKDRLTVKLNGITVIDNAQLPGIAAEGPLALQDDHASNNTFQFANLFLREL